MSRVFKVKVQDTLQNGEFTSEECGQKVSQVLEWYGSTRFEFIETDEFVASTKKSKVSKSQPATFNDMVKNQRNKNIKKEFTEDEDMRKYANYLNYRNLELIDLIDNLKSNEPPKAKGLYNQALGTLESAQQILEKAVNYYYRRGDGLDY